jgi:hypothetical protein
MAAPWSSESPELNPYGTIKVISSELGAVAKLRVWRSTKVILGSWRSSEFGRSPSGSVVFLKRQIAR